MFIAVTFALAESRNCSEVARLFGFCPNSFDARNANYALDYSSAKPLFFEIIAGTSGLP